MPRADQKDLEAGLNLAKGPIRRVADVGGGTGRAIREVTAPSRLVVDPAIGMLRRVPVPVDAVRGTATDLPVADDSLDAVLIVDALHHLPAVDEVLAEVYRGLRPGGVLVVVDFDPSTVRGRFLVAAERLIRFDSTFYRPGALSDRLADHGFTPNVVTPGFEYVVVGRVPDSA